MRLARGLRGSRVRNDNTIINPMDWKNAVVISWNGKQWKNSFRGVSGQAGMRAREVPIKSLGRDAGALENMGL